MAAAIIRLTSPETVSLSPVACGFSRRYSARKANSDPEPENRFPRCRPDHLYLTSQCPCESESAQLVVTPPPDARTRTYNSAHFS
jgi:hypothetical protein